MKFILFAVLLLSTACAEQAESISIDSRFTKDERVMIVDARDSWCDTRLKWCPEIITNGGEWTVIRETDWSALHRSKGALGWTDHLEHRVYVKASFLDEHPEWTWEIVAHEFGHVQWGTHLAEPGHLMSAEANLGEAPLYMIDEDSIQDILE